MTSCSFSPESVEFYINLREQRYSTEFYNENKDIFYESVKPELIAIFEKVTVLIEAHYDNIAFDESTSHIGLSYAHVPAKFAWGAITREYRHKHNDLQLFVALRYDYLRFGFYLPNKDDFQSTFRIVYTNIESNRSSFVSIINELADHGLILAAYTAPDESGKPKPLNFNENYPEIAIDTNKEFSVISGIPVSEIHNIDLPAVIADAFIRLKPLYDMLMNV